MRIDHCLVSASLAPCVVAARILGRGESCKHPSFMGSDHCPVLLVLAVAEPEATRANATDAETTGAEAAGAGAAASGAGGGGVADGGMTGAAVEEAVLEDEEDLVVVEV